MDRALELGHQLLRHRQRLRRRQGRRRHRVDHRAMVRPGRRPAREDRPGDQGLRRDDRVAQRRPAVRPAHPAWPARTVCGACRPTTSTSTRCTTSTGPTPWEEVWQAIDTLVQQGKILYVGSQQLRRLAHRPGERGRRPSRTRSASSASRASTTCWTGPSSSRCCPPAASTAWASSRGARWRAGCSAASSATPTARVASRPQSLKRIEKLRPKLEAWEQLCAELGEEPADGGAGVAARPGRRHRPIIGPRTLGPARRRLAARPRDHPRRGHARTIDTIFPGPGGTAPEAYAW